MANVSEQLRYFIRYKLQHDQLWRGLRIILSDGSVPGEGEHKIMQHIRSARELPRRHCIYGLDADLIMLGLATHAPAIVLLREKVVFRAPKADSPNKVLPFAFNLEAVIDDLLVLAFMVGNDCNP